MILFPAIDLKDGACVRLEQGEMDRATTFNEDPAAQARAFEAQGFDYLHIVDLNGAFEGASVNSAAVEGILSAISIPAQLGGGIRNMDHVTHWLSKGLARVILGTAAVEDPAFVKEAARTFPGQVAVGIDAKDGRVATKGWAEVTDLSAAEVARRFEDDGIAAIIFTDIARDGMLGGMNLEATRRLAQKVSIPVIASGGLSSLEDIHALAQDENRVLGGAITGRALYDGRIDAAEALKILRGADA